MRNNNYKYVPFDFSKIDFKKKRNKKNFILNFPLNFVNNLNEWINLRYAL